VKPARSKRRLADVCELDKVQGRYRDLPYVGLEDIEAHAARFIGTTDLRSVQSNTFRFSKNHVLYGRLRPYLNKVFAPDFDGHCSTEIFPLRPRPELLREYLVYWFLARETVERINATCTGARMPRADMQKVMQFELPIPSLEEQRRTVRLLDEALEAVQSISEACAANVANARGLFASRREQIFRDRGDHWLERPLRELCDIKHGFAFKGEFFVKSGEYVLLTPGNFYESGGYRDRGDKQKFYRGDVPEGYVLAEGDLLVAMTEQAPGLLGSPALIPESGRFLHNQRLGLVSGKPGAPWTNEFFFHVFNTPELRRAVHASASGVKVRHTSPSKIGEIVVAFPASVAERKAIASRLAELQEEAESLASLYERKRMLLSAFRDALLRDAFGRKS
jgi:type I restriction enzyme, S subunit